MKLTDVLKLLLQESSNAKILEPRNGLDIYMTVEYLGIIATKIHCRQRHATRKEVFQHPVFKRIVILNTHDTQNFLTGASFLRRRTSRLTS